MSAIAGLPAVPEALIQCVGRGLADEDVLVRLHASKAAEVARAGALVPALVRALSDATWTVRWRAAVALIGTSVEAEGERVLLECQPRNPVFDATPAAVEWERCARKYASRSPALAAHLDAPNSG